ncbi:N6-adenine-specific methylase [Leptospira ryugenii]|uniref:N6-adenine-specific methylase n=1 Tax=Leptospira ryugenii TaxID=1917863 RepID=A0A2P2E0A9_9LEPT|nr:RsmD family RNA methyltransferase [Leptospira ryugenii]GBF50246.1 N6-adenine-specific methylase [Leptospira ryugenii]
MKSLRVSQGIWKGKEIPCPEEVSGHLNFTNSLVKKSLFDVIDSRLDSWGISNQESLFCDFFSGSGQISAEAYSRGFGKILVYELDQKRFSGLLQLFKGIKTITLFRKDATKHAIKWELGEEKAYIFYLDPPYTYWSVTPTRMSSMLLQLVSHLNDLNKPYLILSQIPEHQKVEEIWSGLEYKVREYGSHSLVELSCKE